MKKRVDLHRGEGLAFLLSMPRSGSTAFSMMLGTHSAILSPPEPWILLPLADLLGIGELGNIPYGEESAALATLRYLARFVTAGDEAWLGKTVRKAAQARVAGTDAELVLRELASKLYARNLSLSKKRLFLDKTPRYYRILPLIDGMFPLAKKIFLVRNPMDVASSYKSTWGTPVDELSGHRASAISLDFCDGLFRLDAYFSRRSATKHVVRYEALVQNPRAVLARACEFLGVRFESEMLRFYEDAKVLAEHRNAVVGDSRAANTPGPLDARSIDKWRVGLSVEEKRQLANALGAEIFRRLGYAKVLDQLRDDGVRIPAEKSARAHRAAVTHRLTVDGAKADGGLFGILVRLANDLLGAKSHHVAVIARMAADLSVVEASRNQFREKSESLTTEKAALEQERIATTAEIQRLKTELAVVDADRHRWRIRSEHLETEKVAFEQERTVTTEEIHRLKTELAVVDADRHRWRIRGEHLEGENRRLAGELTALGQDHEVNKAAVARLVSELATLREAAEQERREIAALMDKLQTQSAQAQALRDEHTRLEQKSLAAHKLLAESRAEANVVREAMLWQAKTLGERAEKLMAEQRAETNALREAMVWQAKSHAARAATIMQWLEDSRGSEKDQRVLNASLNDQLKSALEQINTLTAWVHEARALAQRLQAAYDGTLSRRIARVAQRLRRSRARALGEPAK